MNNIPKKKLAEKISSALAKCEICSNKQAGYYSVSDNLCDRCSTVVVACNRFYEANIPIEYWSLKMERDFKGAQILLKKYNEITDDLKESYSSGKSMCFAGPYGIGKTLTLTGILKKASAKGYTALYTTLSDAVSVMTSAPHEDRYLAKRELTMVDFLVLDEFDERYMATENAADLYARTLEGIFRTRSQNKMPTYLSTNSPNVIESFTGSLKASLDSLMNGYLEMVPIFGQDFRKANK